MTMNKIKLITEVFEQKGKTFSPFSGKGLFSLLLPDNLIYEKKNNAMKDEPIVKIYRPLSKGRIFLICFRTFSGRNQF